MHRIQELLRLCRMGKSDRKIARSLGMGRNTVRAYRDALSKSGVLSGPTDSLPDLEELASAVRLHLPEVPPPPQMSTLVDWDARIRALYLAGTGPTAIHDRLHLEDPEYQGSLSSVKRLCARIKRERGVQPEDVALPVETLPGEVAYVDFGYAGLRYDPTRGILRKSWVFVMVLGHSRHMVAYLVFDQKIETWIRLHVRAFQDLGGVPEILVPDNLKAAVVRAAFGIDDDATIQRSYRELARHYGFQIEPTRPRKPEHKGKVESGVKYVKRNGLRSFDSVDLETDQRALQRWLVEIAGKRRHGTTGRSPIAMFEAEERAALRPLPTVRFELVVWKKVKVHTDTHVQIDGAFYSAPWRHLHQELWARCTPAHITLYAGDQRVADHARVERGKRQTREEHLPDHRAPLRHRSRSHWEARAAAIGPQTVELVRRVFDSDDVLSKLRPVQAIVTHLQRFPVHRAEAACERALVYGCLDFRGVRNILTKGLDLLPLPVEPPRAWSERSRFARSPAETIHSLRGGSP